jgi:hypothetical protein
MAKSGAYDANEECKPECSKDASKAEEDDDSDIEVFVYTYIQST